MNPHLATQLVCGVLLALIYKRIVPEAFGLGLSVEFLAMIVIGGLGSIRGAVLGGIFVSALPKVLAGVEGLPGGFDPTVEFLVLLGFSGRGDKDLAALKKFDDVEPWASAR